MNNQTKEKSCEDCVYYLRHYRKDFTHYHPVGCRHCTNRPKGKPFRKTAAICECFEEKNPQIINAGQNKSIKELLSNIAAKLTELAAALENEN